MVFSVAKKILQDITIATGHIEICKLHKSTALLATNKSVRSSCVQNAKMWVGYLESLSTFAELEGKLRDSGAQHLGKYMTYPGPFCSPSCGLLHYIEKSCLQGVQEAKLIKFTGFLPKKGEEPE